MNRRHVLQTGAASLMIIGGAPACRQDAPALSAWRAAPSDYDDLRIRYLASAILAPSPHNRQPWLIALDPDDPMGMTLFADPSRLLPETDPPNRQILIGLGAFLETLSMAAAQDERAVDIEMFPQGVGVDYLDARPIALLNLGEVGTARPDPFFPFVPSRRTNRARFDNIPVAKDELLGLGTALKAPTSFWGASADPELCETLRELCKAGWEVETKTERTHAESVALTRIGRKEIEANPDGISLSGPMMSAYSTLGILSREKMKDPQSRAFKGGLDFYNGLIDSARSFAWLATMDNSRESQLSAGRDWMRVHLASTRAGLAFHPLSQVLQEFPEMSSLYASIHEATGIQAPSRIQGLFRIGFAASPDPSPRWPLQTRLIDISDL